MILIDVSMPEMDGLELLELIKEKPNLKNIPIIMLASQSDMESIYSCIDRGANDYVVKPIRAGTLRGIINQINFDLQSSDNEDDEVGLRAYDVVRNLGRGAQGSVNLVRKKSTGEMFAMKRIDLQFMNEKEKRNSENEVMLLRVLNAPTIIKFYE